MRKAARVGILLVVAISTAGCLRVGLGRLRGAATGDGGSDGDGEVDADADGGADGDADADADLEVDADPDESPDAEPDADPDGDPDLDWEVGPCDESPCRLVAPQCGCPPWLACQRPYGDDPRRECVPPGTAGHLETCEVNADCTTAHVCVTASSAPGVCVPYCATGADCPAESVCAEMWVASEPIGSCAPMCDPLTGGLCPSGTACISALVRRLDDAALVAGTLCGPDDELPGVGESCTAVCRQGAFCMGSTCEQLCVLSSPSCASGTCRAIGGWIVRGVEFGTCR